MFADETCVGALVHEQGVLAKNKDLVKAFGTDKQLEVCRIILEKGEMQVRDLGRTDGGNGRGEIGEAYRTTPKRNRTDYTGKQPLYFVVGALSSVCAEFACM